MTTKSELESNLPETLAKTAIEASSLYGFLANVFRKEMSLDFLQYLRSAPMRGALAEIGVDLGAEFNDKPDDELLEDLSVEFAGLFIGPGGHISPHESVYNPHDSRLWGDETVAVKAYIEGTGFNYNDSFTGVPDHISVELDFMSAIAKQEAQAWEAADVAAAGNCLEFEMEFLDKHLGRWAPRFCKKVIAATGDSIYGQMAQLTRDFLASEREDLQRRTEAVLANGGVLPREAPGENSRKSA